MYLRTTMVSLALAASLGLAACGGGDEGDSGLARAKLVKKADAACSKALTAARAVAVPESLDDATVAAAFFGKIAPITHEKTEALAALEPAADVKADWDVFIAKQRAVDDLLQKITRKAKAKDPSGQQDLAGASGPAEEVAAAARKVGAKQCAIKG